MIATCPDTPKRPILRYPGGKWLLAPWIIAQMPPHRCYVEPFGGAGSVFMQKPRAYTEVLNDLNGELVSLFTILRDPLQASELERLVRLTPYALAEYEAAFTPASTPLERVRRLLIRSWQGFNGEGTLGHKSGWRSCSENRGTLPVQDWAKFPDAIASFTARLQGVIIDHRDALALFPRYDTPETLWYIDPPYDEAVCPAFGGYAASIEHQALRSMLEEVCGMVLVSGYHSPLYDGLYKDWRCMERRTYAGAGTAKARRRVECLWMNQACVQGQAQLYLY